MIPTRRNILILMAIAAGLAGCGDDDNPASSTQAQLQPPSGEIVTGSTTPSTIAITATTSTTTLSIVTTST